MANRRAIAASGLYFITATGDNLYWAPYVAAITTTVSQPSSAKEISKYLALAIYEDEEIFQLLRAFLNSRT